VKPIAKEEFEGEHKNLIKDLYTSVKKDGKHIHAMVKDTNKMLRVSNSAQFWRAYVDFISNVDMLFRLLYNIFASKLTKQVPMHGLEYLNDNGL
jgi:hypothetical protein